MIARKIFCLSNCLPKDLLLYGGSPDLLLTQVQVSIDVWSLILMHGYTIQLSSAKHQQTISHNS